MINAIKNQLNFKKKLKDEDEIDKKVKAVSGLMQHYGWPTFVELIQYMQGLEMSRLFEQSFLALNPVEKDKQHYAIVRQLQLCERLLELPQWLNRKRPSRWADVTQHMIKEQK